MNNINVIIVDDSALMRRIFSEMINREPSMNVIATAIDPLFAMDKMDNNWPDVIVTDIMMPRMDGLTFIKKIMSSHPTPMIAISAFAKEGETLAIEALRSGALFFIEKPNTQDEDKLHRYQQKLIDKIKLAITSDVRNLQPDRPITPTTAATDKQTAINQFFIPKNIDLIAIGTSTGGVQTLEKIFSNIQSPMPPIVVVIHMPNKFVKAFVERLNELSKFTIQVASYKQRAQENNVYLCPGDKHLMVKKQDDSYFLLYDDSAKINHIKPSVDILYKSVAMTAGKNALGILLTGMGKDGAEGLLAIKNAQGTTIIQDEASSVVYGMPKAAKELQANNIELHINDIIAILKNKINIETG